MDKSNIGKVHDLIQGVRTSKAYYMGHEESR